MKLRAKILPGLALGVSLAATAMLVNPLGVSAHPGEGVPGTVALDFLTGGGFIIRDSGAKGNFGIQGGVKHGDWWGGVNYIDHGNGLHVQGREVTGYLFIDERTRDIEGRRQNEFRDAGKPNHRLPQGNKAGEHDESAKPSHHAASRVAAARRASNSA